MRGQTLHDAETAEVNRQYRQQVRNTNPYVVDNTVSGRTGPLPSPPPQPDPAAGRAGPLPSPPQPVGDVTVVVDTDGIYETASYIQDYEYGWVPRGHCNHVIVVVMRFVSPATSSVAR